MASIRQQSGKTRARYFHRPAVPGPAHDMAGVSHEGVELNPIVRALMPWTGTMWAVLISKGTLVLLILLLNRRIWILRFANVLYTCVLAWNIWIVWALQSRA